MADLISILPTLAQIFITFTAMSGIIDGYKRFRPDSVEVTEIGLRLSMRFGLYGTGLSMLPLVLHHTFGEYWVWGTSVIIFAAMLIVELNNAWREMNPKPAKVTENKEPRPSTPLTWVGICMAFFMLGSFITAGLGWNELSKVYLFNLGLWLCFMIAHFIVYTHPENYLGRPIKKPATPSKSA